MKKKKFLVISVCSLLLICLVIFPAFAESGILKFNNTLFTNSIFTISSTGRATINAHYTGSDDTTGATISFKIQRKILGLFWVDYDNGQPDNTWVYNVSGTYYTVSYTLSLPSSGKYRTVFQYTVYGSGEPDIIDEIVEYEY